MQPLWTYRQIYISLRWYLVLHSIYQGLVLLIKSSIMTFLKQILVVFSKHLPGIFVVLVQRTVVFLLGLSSKALLALAITFPDGYLVALTPRIDFSSSILVFKVFLFSLECCFLVLFFFRSSSTILLVESNIYPSFFIVFLNHFCIFVSTSFTCCLKRFFVNLDEFSLDF